MLELIRVIHVDDDTAFSELTTTFLEREDERIAVETAASAAEASKRLAEEEFDCIVSDYNMPGQNGIEFLETVREEYPAFPFILFTGKGSEEVASDAISAGVSDYLQKQPGTEQYELLANRIVNVVTKRRAETNYRELFEKVSVGLALFDPDTGYITNANRAFGELVGYDHAALTGRHPGALFFEGSSYDTERGMQLFQDILETGSRRVEWKYHTDDRTPVWLSIQFSRTTIDGQRQVLAVVQDVTDRKRREQKLKQLRERSRHLTYTQTVDETTQLAVDAADDIIGAPLSSVHLLNDEGTVLEPSAAAESLPRLFDELPSFERAAPSGSRAALVWDVFQSDESIHLSELSTSELLTEQSPAESAVLHPIGDHGVFIIAAPTANAFADTDVLLVEILATYLETALDRVEREQTLRGREYRLGRLHSATRDLIQADSQQAIADRVIEAAEEILGFSIAVVRLYDPDAGGLVPVAESDAVADRVSERVVFTPDSNSLNWAAFEAGEVRVYDDIETVEYAVDQGTGLRSLIHLPMAEYGTISVGETVPRAFDATDEFLARILATAAETAFQAEERERKLLRRRDEVERQNDRLEQFASVVSHDLRNPLQVADGYLEMIQEECESEHFDDVTVSLDRMNALIDDLLTLAREGKHVNELNSVEPAKLARACWRNVETDDSALTAERTRKIRADRSRLQQLLENLFRNAVEHGGKTVSVTVGELEAGFYVEDTGTGIPPDCREDVFDTGYSTSATGTGLGLSIVKQVVDAHGWDIRVTEGADGGARFEITGVEFVE